MPEPEEPATGSPTPILDSGVLPPRIRQITLRNLLVGFLIGIVPSFVGVCLILVGRQANDNLGFDLLSFFSVLVLATAVHEVGHLLAGWVVGFRFSLIQIGPLSFRLVHGVLKARFRREMSALGYAGMHVNRLRRLRRRMLIFLAAGPAVNLLSVPIVVFLLHTFPQLVNTWVAIPAAQFAVVSFLLGALSLMPFSSTATSDGARIAMLLRSRDRARRWLNILALVHASDRGIRAKLWKNSWLRAASSLNDVSRDNFRGNLLAYVSANGREDAPVAAYHLERCLKLAGLQPISMRDFLAQESAVFAAWFQNDALLAGKWFAQLRKPKLLSRLSQIRVHVATSCARCDFDGALACWEEGLAFINRKTAGTSQKLLKESWLEWQAEILKRQNQPPAMEGRYTARPHSIRA